MKTISRSLIASFCLLTMTLAVGYVGETSAEPEPRSQDVSGLSQRITSLEQRFYSIESSINQLRQQMISMRPSAGASGVADPRVDRLQSELQLLQLRIRELECAAVKLDERTLPQSAREQGRAQSKQPDPCRAQPNTPVQLSSRPR